jgi:hypothetical protein
MSNLALIGAGQIGTAAALAARDDGICSAISVIVDPDASARAELVAQTGASAHASTAELSSAIEGDRALVAFSSDARKVGREIIQLVSLGYHCVTTCEELAWPDRHLWEALHTAAATEKRVIIVTGANPGFAMDRFPLLAAAATRSPSSIDVTRRVNTSRRRETLVAKSGRGLTADEFETAWVAGRAGHKGLEASARLLAHSLKWDHNDLRETIEPIVRDRIVTGYHQKALVRTTDGRTISLHLTLDADLEDEYDQVIVDGTPPITMRIEGGYHGDEGATAQILMALRRCNELDPGFYRPTDLPLRFG